MMKGTSTVNDTGTSGTRSKVVVILGAQWGDEGKGRMADMFSQHADVACRCQVCSLLCNVSSIGEKGCAILKISFTNHDKYLKISRYSIYRDTGFETVKNYHAQKGTGGHSQRDSAIS